MILVSERLQEIALLVTSARLFEQSETHHTNTCAFSQLSLILRPPSYNLDYIHYELEYIQNKAAYKAS